MKTLRMLLVLALLAGGMTTLAACSSSGRGSGACGGCQGGCVCAPDRNCCEGCRQGTGCTCNR